MPEALAVPAEQVRARPYMAQAHATHYPRAAAPVTTSAAGPRTTFPLNIMGCTALASTDPPLSDLGRPSPMCGSPALGPVSPASGAAVELRLEAWGEAARHCSEVLKREPQNTKALFRRSKANQGKEWWNEAEADMRQCTLLDPEVQCRPSSHVHYAHFEARAPSESA